MTGRKKIQKSNIKCQDNLILNFLPESLLNKVKENLNDIPETIHLDSCNLNNNTTKSCCNLNTISIFKEYINDLVELKKNIFENNLFYFTLIQKEHQRNFVEGFGLDKEIFNSLFEEYITFKMDFYNITQKIVNESIKYTWNSLCNYICRSDYNNFFEAYNDTYLENNTSIYELNIEFFNDDNQIIKIKDLITEFYDLEKNFNTSINNIYKKMISNYKSLNYSILYNKTLVEKSLSDGRDFFLGLKNKFVCDKNSYIIECSVLIQKNICKPFLCLDNIFMQFIDDSFEPFSSNWDKYNFAKANYTKNTSVYMINYDSEIAEIIKNNIQFNTSFYLKIGNIFILLFFYFLF